MNEKEINDVLNQYVWPGLAASLRERDTRIAKLESIVQEMQGILKSLKEGIGKKLIDQALKK